MDRAGACLGRQLQLRACSLRVVTHLGAWVRGRAMRGCIRSKAHTLLKSGLLSGCQVSCRGLVGKALGSPLARRALSPPPRPNGSYLQQEVCVGDEQLRVAGDARHAALRRRGAAAKGWARTGAGRTPSSHPHASGQGHPRQRLRPRVPAALCVRVWPCVHCSVHTVRRTKQRSPSRTCAPGG